MFSVVGGGKRQSESRTKSRLGVCNVGVVCEVSERYKEKRRKVSHLNVGTPVEIVKKIV